MSAQKYKVTNNKPSKSNLSKVVVMILAILLVLGVGYYFYNKKQGNNKNIDTAQTSSAKTDVINQDNNPSTDQVNPSKPDDKVSNTTSDKIPTSTTSTVKVTSFSQAGGQVKVVAETTGDGTGKCVFSFTTPDDKPVVKEATVTNNKCEISVPEVEFTKIGKWNLAVTYYANDKKAEVNQDVTIN